MLPFPHSHITRLPFPHDYGASHTIGPERCTVSVVRSLSIRSALDRIKHHSEADDEGGGGDGGGAGGAGEVWAVEQGQGLDVAVLPGLGLDELVERTAQYLQEAGTPGRAAMMMLQLLSSAHIRAAAQRTQQQQEEAAGGAPREVAPAAAERLLYTEEAIEAIDEALAAEELEDDAAAQAEADITPPGPSRR